MRIIQVVSGDREDSHFVKIGKASLNHPEILFYGGENSDLFTTLDLSVSNCNSQPYTSFHFASAAVIVDCAKNWTLLSKITRGYIFCDSRPLQLYLVAAMRVEKYFRQSRGTGFFEFAWRHSTEQMNHFLIVPNQETFNLLQKLFISQKSLGQISGYLVPPLTEDMNGVASEAVSLIRESRANIVWIGIGAPKQIVLADLISSKIPVVTVTIGGAMEIVSGQRKEAPLWIQRFALEWLFRWIQEPRRLTKRYVVGNMSFLKILIMDFMKTQFTYVRRKLKNSHE